jgi:flavin-dependent dehydrogenase
MLAELHRLLPATGDVHDVRGHRLPLSTGRTATPDGRVLLVGDAACLVHPLTGEGIHAAVVSGALAGRVAAAGADAGRRHRAQLRRTLGRHLRHRNAIAALGRRPGLVDRAVAGTAGRPGAFADLVRFGLADGPVTVRLLAAVALPGGR